MDANVAAIVSSDLFGNGLLGALPSIKVKDSLYLCFCYGTTKTSICEIILLEAVAND